LFSFVACKTLDISQGGVATHLRCGGITVIMPPDDTREVLCFTAVLFSNTRRPPQLGPIRSWVLG